MKTKTNVKAGRLASNHNQTTASGLRVRAALKAAEVAYSDFQVTQKVNTGASKASPR